MSAHAWPAAVSIHYWRLCVWAWLVARGNGKGVSLERHGERAGGSEVFRQVSKSRGTCASCHRVFRDVCACHRGSGAVGRPCAATPGERCRVRTRLPEKSIRQRGGRDADGGSSWSRQQLRPDCKGSGAGARNTSEVFPCWKALRLEETRCVTPGIAVQRWAALRRI